jgi:hypothetical protein
MIRRVKIPTITTVGSNGSATGNDVTPIPIVGRILAVYIDYTSQPSTTDVTLATIEAPVKTILTVTDTNSDGWFYPRTAVHSAAGAAVTYDGTRPIYDSVPVADIVKATVAQGDSAKTVDITIEYEE